MKTIVVPILVTIFISPLMLPDPPEINDVTALSVDLQKWHKRGDYVEIEGNKLFYIYERCKRKSVENSSTFVIIHGFPSSSYEYHKVTKPQVVTVFKDVTLGSYGWLKKLVLKSARKRGQASKESEIIVQLKRKLRFSMMSLNLVTPYGGFKMCHP